MGSTVRPPLASAQIVQRRSRHSCAGLTRGLVLYSRAHCGLALMYSALSSAAHRNSLRRGSQR